MHRTQLGSKPISRRVSIYLGYKATIKRSLPVVIVLSLFAVTENPFLGGFIFFATSTLELAIGCTLYIRSLGANEIGHRAHLNLLLGATAIILLGISTSFVFFRRWLNLDVHFHESICWVLLADVVILATTVCFPFAHHCGELDRRADPEE